MTDGGLRGLLNINKPLRWTSHDVVARIRGRARDMGRRVKVGHAGTLDPLADGVLVVCLGAATRLSDYVMRGRKTYRAEITLGATTDTYDSAGEVLSRTAASHITREDIDAALPQFLGAIEQLPPMYSAIKVGGTKLYELARQGKSIERKPRAITIYSIQILRWESPIVDLEIVCGAGTYIRSLAHDLGAALGVGAYLSGLTRAASGSFTLADSVNLESLLALDDWRPHIVSPFCALADYPRLALATDDILRLRNGQFIARESDCAARQVFAFDSQRELVAILQPRGECWKPHKVFPPVQSQGVATL